MIRLVKPCRGHVTQWYGNIQSHDGRKHTGQDYAYYSGGQVTDEVFAAADGVVLYAGDSRNLNWPNAWYLNPDFNRNDAVDSSAGNVVVLGHKQGTISFDTTYNHLAAWSVKAGQPVKAGQRIATIGDSGFSAGKHLHFELLFRPFNFGTDVYGRADPNPYFATGLATQGTTTPQEPEEDDMPTAADLLYEPVPKYDVDGKEIGTTSLAETIAWNEANFLRQRQLTIDGIKETVLGVLTTQLTNVATGGTTSLGTEASWAAWNAKRDAQGGIDANAVADDIAKAIAAKLTAATVTKEMPNG